MDKMTFFIRFYIVALAIILLNGAMVIAYIYLEDWMFSLMDYIEAMQETYEKASDIKLKHKILIKLAKMSISFVRVYELVVRHIDVLNIMGILDDMEWKFHD